MEHSRTCFICSLIAENNQIVHAKAVEVCDVGWEPLDEVLKKANRLMSGIPTYPTLFSRPVAVCNIFAPDCAIACGVALLQP